MEITDYMRETRIICDYCNLKYKTEATLKKDCEILQMLINLINFDIKLCVKDSTINYHIDLLNNFMKYLDK